MHRLDKGVSQLIKCPHNEPKFDCDIFGIPDVIGKVRVLKVETVGPLSMLLGVRDASADCQMFLFLTNF